MAFNSYVYLYACEVLYRCRWLLVVLIRINSSNEIWLAAFIEIKINKFEEVKTEFLITLIEYTIVK